MENKIIKIILLFLMCIRHSMFYFDVGYIHTEMGYDQSTFGILLIPITAAFGCFAFLNNRKEFVSTRYTIRLIAISFIPIFISLFSNNFTDLFRYTIFNTDRRPTFLILLPICYSIIYVTYFSEKKYLFIFLAIACLFFKDLFIVHYMLLFITFYFINKKITDIRFRHWYLVYPLSYFLVFFVIINSMSVRVSIIEELAFAFGFLYILKVLALFIIKLLNSLTISFNLPNLSILNFYVIQGILFTFAKSFIHNQLPIIMIAFIFIFSFLGSILINNMFSKHVMTDNRPL